MGYALDYAGGALRGCSPARPSHRPPSVRLAMLVPEAETGTTHLRLLAQVARALTEEQLRAQLLSAPEEQAIFDLLKSKSDI